ncbi:MAG: hypothetical protein ACUVRL_10940 [Candidatus Saccharicenans sp.]|uniref:hypothetical protein n=1 Tax=Candidatus Saccharicenans sp. TaxID=2819258 RepID=UPI00404B703F
MRPATTALLLGLWCLFGLVSSAGAVEARAFFTAGVFNFRQAEFRQLYGQMPALGLSLDLFSGSNLGLTTGVHYFKASGLALTLAGEPAVYPVEFYRWTFPFLLKYRLVTGNFQLAAGAGLALSIYDESWSGVELSYHGQKIHFRAELTADVRLLSRLYLRAGMNWESIPTGVSSMLLGGGRVNLAGLSLQAGIGTKI